MRVLLVYPNLPLMLVPPLSIAIFTSILKKLKCQVELFDTTGYIYNEDVSPKNRVKFLQAREFNDHDDLGIVVKQNLLDDFRKKIIDFKPQAMIFSVVEDAFEKTLKMLKHIEDMDIPHIIGGVFPTAAPELCMKNPNVKLIGLGEGENIIIDFIEAIRKNTTLDKIPGTWYKDNNGNIHKNIPQRLIDIDLIKPDFSLFEKERFYRPMGGRIFKTVPVETYRGCPYTCSFCNSPMQVSFAKCSGQGSFIRKKSIPELREEFQGLIKNHSPEFIYFIDDSFTARPNKEIYEFCEMYKEFKIPFWFNTRPEQCSQDVLEILKNVGCYRISFGIECGNEEFRKRMLNRHVTNEILLKHFEIISKCGISFSINLIIGFPEETRELIMETIELVRMIKNYDTITVSMFTPYHGTVLRKIAEDNNWIGKDKITIHTTSESMLNMPKPYLSREELSGIMRVIVLYCSFSKSEWDHIRRAEINDKKGNEIFGYYSGIYSDKFLKRTQEDIKENVNI
ncbi:MAG: radical SAM protein [Candidatus Woesearchaeota archaeon]|jgi:radical SAM superfamily enzyme YgiQ (UPF0313 family)